MATGDAAAADGTESAGQPGSGPSALPIEFLSQALQRLTSEVLIYLLAYAVLVASLVIWGGSVNAALRNILYILPPLGVAAYLYQQRRRIKSSRPPRVAVSVLFAGRDAIVAGIRGTWQPADVRVKAGFATGKVVGVETGQQAESAAADITYLTELFNKLETKGRQKVIQVATQLQPED
jgi:hypothetical protein